MQIIKRNKTSQYIQKEFTERVEFLRNSQAENKFKIKFSANQKESSHTLETEQPSTQ